MTASLQYIAEHFLGIDVSFRSVEKIDSLLDSFIDDGFGGLKASKTMSRT